MPYHRGKTVDILVVEDNPGDARLLQAVLDGATLVVHHVPDLKSAIVALRERTFAAALLDLRLPDATGTDGVRSLLAVAPDLPLVVLTGLDDEALAVACIDAGAQDYLVKDDLTGRRVSRAVAYAIARVRERAAHLRADDLARRLAAIVESSRDAIVSGSVDGTITSWNLGAEQVFGIPAADAIGRPVADVIPLDDPSQRADRQQRLATLARGESVGMLVLPLRRADGTEVILQVQPSFLRDADGKPAGVAAILRDVTESRRRDALLERQNEELKARELALVALRQHQETLVEDERTRIAREIHDVLGQLLTGLRIDLRWVVRRLTPSLGANHEVIARLDATDALVQDLVTTVQRISVELRPSVLDALGFASAVRDECRRFATRTGLRVDATVDVSVDVPKDDAIGLFRIFQELLTNVARHAHAGSVRVSLERAGGDLVLVVRDDGVGIGDAGDSATSLGVLGMRERAAAMGGRIALASAPDGGTVATVRVPQRGTG